MRSSQTALEAARNKLRILGLTDDDIATFQEKGRINPETTIFAPISGTVVQRKIGPGQYVSAGASDPVFVIGDLSTVWLTAFVRETDAPRLGRPGNFLQRAGAAGPPLTARINYVSGGDRSGDAPAAGPRHHRQQGRLLKPEMFANVTIYSPATIPRSACRSRR
jgi:cobalt-zinc-cadmium efflux system membrane fusion protein